MCWWKNLSLSIEEGRASLVALGRARDSVCSGGRLLWYHPAVLKLRALVGRGGELGRIQYIYSQPVSIWGKIRREENIFMVLLHRMTLSHSGLVGEMPDVDTAQGGN